MRFHYLLSLAGVSLGITALLIYLVLLYPFPTDVTSPWLALASVPYFLLYARDLSATGYRRRDVFRVYALNLVLVPINAGGVLRSVQKWFTRAPVTFARTPKVARRTAVPPLYVWLEYLIAFGLLVAGVTHMLSSRWIYGSFLLLTGGFVVYALIALVGPRASLQDLGLERLASSTLKSRVLRRNEVLEPIPQWSAGGGGA